MTTTTMLTPLKAAGFGLAVPPRAGRWWIDPAFSAVEFRLRDGHRTSLLSVPVRDGELSLSEPAGTSVITLRLAAAEMRSGTRRTASWVQAAGLDTAERASLFTSEIVLASPRGWRKSGRLRSKRLDDLFVLDVTIRSVSTQLDGRDAMALTAAGSLARAHVSGARRVSLGHRVHVRLHAERVHD